MVISPCCCSNEASRCILLQRNDDPTLFCCLGSSCFRWDSRGPRVVITQTVVSLWRRFDGIDARFLAMERVLKRFGIQTATRTGFVLGNTNGGQMELNAPLRVSWEIRSRSRMFPRVFLPHRTFISVSPAPNLNSRCSSFSVNSSNFV